MVRRESEPGRTTPATRRVGHSSTGATGSVFRRRPQWWRHPWTTRCIHSLRHSFAATPVRKPQRQAKRHQRQRQERSPARRLVGIPDRQRPHRQRRASHEQDPCKQPPSQRETPGPTPWPTPAHAHIVAQPRSPEAAPTPRGELPSPGDDSPRFERRSTGPSKCRRVDDVQTLIAGRGSCQRTPVERAGVPLGLVVQGAVDEQRARLLEQVIARAGLCD